MVKNTAQKNADIEREAREFLNGGIDPDDVWKGRMAQNWTLELNKEINLRRYDR